jgi:hypothetical protein
MPPYLEPGARVSERWSPGGCVKVDLREPPATTEDPMTDDRMALVDLLQKSGDAEENYANQTRERTKTDNETRGEFERLGSSIAGGANRRLSFP